MKITILEYQGLKQHAIDIELISNFWIDSSNHVNIEYFQNKKAKPTIFKAHNTPQRLLIDIFRDIAEEINLLKANGDKDK